MSKNHARRRLKREEERRHHLEHLAEEQSEHLIQEARKEQLIEEGILCFACGYPLWGGWCWRCHEKGVKQI